jgi:hypothetical protein
VHSCTFDVMGEHHLDRFSDPAHFRSAVERVAGNSFVPGSIPDIAECFVIRSFFCLRKLVPFQDTFICLESELCLIMQTNEVHRASSVIYGMVLASFCWKWRR